MANNNFKKRVKESWKNVRQMASRAWMNWGREATQKCLEGVLIALAVILCFFFVVLWPMFYFWSLVSPRAMAELCNDDTFGNSVTWFNTWTIRCLPWYAKKVFMEEGVNCFFPKTQVKYYHQNPEFFKYMDIAGKKYLWEHGNVEDKLRLAKNYRLNDSQFIAILPYYNCYDVIRVYSENWTLTNEMLKAILAHIKCLNTIPNNGCVGELKQIFLNYARKNDLIPSIRSAAKEIQDQNFQSTFKECYEIREQVKVIRGNKYDREFFYPWCKQNQVYPEAQKSFNLMQIQAFLASGQRLSSTALQEFVRLAERQEYQQILKCFFESSPELPDEMIDIVRTSSYAMKVRAQVAAAKNE